jgi:hypothetical protein
LRSCVIVLRDRRSAGRVTESARNYCMRADIYQKLHEFNLHIEQGVAALLGLSQVKKVKSYLLRRYAENFEEIKTAASGYLTSLISDQEEDEAGRLFAKRRHEEMAEDPMRRLAGRRAGQETAGEVAKGRECGQGVEAQVRAAQRFSRG